MSNDDSMPPNTPRDDSETGLGRLGQGSPEAGDSTDSAGLVGDESSVSDGVPVDDATPPGGGVPADPTQVMPTTPARPSLPTDTRAMAAGAVPPGSPTIPPGPGAATAPRRKPPLKWYQQPGLVAGVLLGLLAIGALGVFLFLANDDDDDLVADGEADQVALSLTRIDANGNPLVTTIAAEVRADDSSPFSWVSPSGVAAGEPGRLQTDAEGRVEFRWAAVGDDVTDFESSVVLREFVAGTPGAGDFVESILAECTIDTDGRTTPLAVDTTLTADPSSESTTQAGEYSFPNATFGAGDRIECTLIDVAPPLTSVPPESTTIPETTLVEVTTTVPETTVPETTTTTTSTTTTTTTTTTLPPEPPAPALGDVLRRDPELSQALALLTRVGLLDELENATQPFTLFVPTNDAIDELRDRADAPDLDDDDVVTSILQVHLSTGQSFTSDQIATITEIPVEIGRPQPVDGEATPPTIGGVDIIGLDLEAEGGVVHVLDGVIERL